MVLAFTSRSIEEFSLPIPDKISEKLPFLVLWLWDRDRPLPIVVTVEFQVDSISHANCE